MFRLTGISARSLLLSICCLTSLGMFRPVAAADSDLAKVTPSGAVFFAEISELEPWIDKLQNSQLVASLPANPQIQDSTLRPQVARRTLAAR